MTAAFTTIGHSNRSLAELLGMLRGAQIGLLVDVRSFPRSRNNPAFNIDRLPADLAQVQIAYRHCPALGGRRPRQTGVPEQLNAMWRLQSFHNYADYALGETFGAAFAMLVRLGDEQRLALMCSEAVWWRCHRRIITDYLLLNGHAVDHLMGPGRTEPAKPFPGARRTATGKIVYPRDRPPPAKRPPSDPAATSTGPRAS
ncbi:MAG TPA: DUF488 domain-containing protein [Sphingobium sp.]|nr:DUF488 domain-containing protein [Sphingobium sp.]